MTTLNRREWNTPHMPPTSSHPTESLRLRLLVVGLVVLLLWLLASPAFAHVTIRSDVTAAGGFAVYTVRVPNESETASTVQIEVQMPEGFVAGRYQPKPGWTQTIADGVLTIEGGEIAPGQFEEFRFQARNPEESGSLTFPALQTYDDGEVAEWIGEPDADMPAPVVEIGAAEGDGGGDGNDAEGADDEADEPTEVAAVDEDTELASAVTSEDGGSDVVSILALGVAVLALLAGGFAVIRSGRA